MHPLTQALVAPAFVASHPITVALLDLGAGATPRETSRPARRKIQMRMLRQWRRLEEALAAFVAAGVTDEDLVRIASAGSAEPFYLENSGWLAPGIDPEFLRDSIIILIAHTTNVKIDSTPPLSYFKTKTSNTMKASQNLEDQFNAVVTSSEPSHTALDKFLRGSLRASNALAKLLEHANNPEAEMDTPLTEALIKDAEDALLAQGFTF